jgi:transposase
VLVVDNASYHRTRAVLALPEEHADHALTVWLPRYSPELNLIEGLWGYLKRSALNNYFYGDNGSLQGATTPHSPNSSNGHKRPSPRPTAPLRLYVRPLSSG